MLIAGVSWRRRVTTPTLLENNRMPIKKCTATLLLLAAACCHTTRADQAADESTIRQAVADYVVAYNKDDAKALAALWSPEAIYTNPVSGEQAVGREAIEQQFASIFTASADAELSVTTDSIQFVSPNVAIEKGTAVVANPGDAAESSQYAAVYVRRDGKWLLDRITEEETSAPPSNYDKLKELEWMTGTWIDGDDQANVVTTCQWAKNKNFLLRMYALTVGDRIEDSGIQIIGWDPVAKQIRSWVFDSEGGYGAGVWNKKGDAWHIQTTGTSPDGAPSSSVNVITHIDDDTHTWQSLNRIAGGELLPNVDEIVVHRQSPQVAQASD
jgi:uncharacterized protein (TIGR02246 family)